MNTEAINKLIKMDRNLLLLLSTEILRIVVKIINSPTNKKLASILKKNKKTMEGKKELNKKM